MTLNALAPASRRQALGLAAAAPLLGLPALAGAQEALTLRDVTHDRALPALGNPKGDVTLVKFFDYQCIYCKRGYPQLQELLKTDPNLRVVLRDLFVYGEDSRYAARLALAAARQDRYAQAVHALLSHSGRLNTERTDAALAAAGVKLDTAKAWVSDNHDRLDALFMRNLRAAQALGFRGTPSYLIGNTPVPGGISLAQMRDIIAQTREAAAKPDAAG